MKIAVKIISEKWRQSSRGNGVSKKRRAARIARDLSRARKRENGKRNGGEKQWRRQKPAAK